MKAPAGGQELVAASQVRCQLVGKELVAAKAYIQGIEPQENLKKFKSFAMRLAADFSYLGELRILAKKANLELTKDKKFPSLRRLPPPPAPGEPANRTFFTRPTLLPRECRGQIEAGHHLEGSREERKLRGDREHRRRDASRRQRRWTGS